MHSVLKEIFDTNFAAPGVPLKDHMDPEEGDIIVSAFRAAKPSVSVEVGMAYGIATLFACDALAAVSPSARHIVLDPFQHTQWNGIGLRNIERAGYGHFVELREEKSEVGLPRLLSEGTKIDAAIIDGWHTFDHTLIDFFYVNKLLNVGGIVVIDDTDMPAIQKVARHILTYPCYELFGQAGGPGPTISPVGAARRFLAYDLGISTLRRGWDIPRAMAFRKIAEDDRSWNWHQPF